MIVWLIINIYVPLCSKRTSGFDMAPPTGSSVSSVSAQSLQGLFQSVYGSFFKAFLKLLVGIISLRSYHQSFIYVTSIYIYIYVSLPIESENCCCVVGCVCGS